MKATLEFDLTNVDDNYDHRRCISSGQMASALFDIKYNLRRKWKYSEKEPNLNEVMDEIHNILDKYNINIEELMA